MGLASGRDRPEAARQAGSSPGPRGDNGGQLIGPAATAELEEQSAVLDLPPEEHGYGFWDVAVAHRDDPVGRQVLDEAGRSAG